MRTHGRRSPRIAIIGSGFGGLCMAIQLGQAGIDSFTIFVATSPSSTSAPR